MWGSPPRPEGRLSSPRSHWACVTPVARRTRSGPPQSPSEDLSVAPGLKNKKAIKFSQQYKRFINWIGFFCFSWRLNRHFVHMYLRFLNYIDFAYNFPKYRCVQKAIQYLNNKHCEGSCELLRQDTLKKLGEPWWTLRNLKFREPWGNLIAWRSLDKSLGALRNLD